MQYQRGLGRILCFLEYSRTDRTRTKKARNQRGRSDFSDGSAGSQLSVGTRNLTPRSELYAPEKRNSQSSLCRGRTQTDEKSPRPPCVLHPATLTLSPVNYRRCYTIDVERLSSSPPLLQLWSTITTESRPASLELHWTQISTRDNNDIQRIRRRFFFRSTIRPRLPRPRATVGSPS